MRGHTANMLPTKKYIRLENDARAAKQGLWADAYPINPSDFRRVVAWKAED